MDGRSKRRRSNEGSTDLMFRDRSEKRQATATLDSAIGLHGPAVQAEFHGEGLQAVHNSNISIGGDVNYGVSRSQCLPDLRSTYPPHDKKRIVQAKGGLLEGSYRWILQHADFVRWRNDPQSHLLWIKGDPGKGKTMLLCGIIEELEKELKLNTEAKIISFFFCQATDSRINNATAVLRGLIYQLVEQQESLISHVRKKYDSAGRQLFEDPNARVALSEILSNILQDPDLQSTYLIIDALDECETHLSQLLNLIRDTSSLSRVKWILSSRNRPDIDKELGPTGSRARLSLELKENAEQVSRAVEIYISYCISKLEAVQYDQSLQDQVRHIMRRKANGTFLWVALVVEELRKVESWDVLAVLDEMPLGLEELYRRMIQQIQQLERKQPDFCRSVLSTVVTTYRPLHLGELAVLSDLPQNVSIAKITDMCGSFLTRRDDIVYIVHQSARDFLSTDKSLFPSSMREKHSLIFSRSLQVMSSILRRNLFDSPDLGCRIEQIQTPIPDPLVTARYSCIYWADHLRDINEIHTESGAELSKFLREKYLYWLEALSLLKSLSEGVVSIIKLEAFVRVGLRLPQLSSPKILNIF
ncbi:NACHT domain-containing protein [Pseudomassariella vexata]|uniref:NACHT domain-domain-containing protein n=1 Tax=Pseudomassariella vexata TaxID=1141098 RepID=A0A1Y2DHK0_9PEZI|nr:NACHT domain-containing protein [Pseudomassariella vexata]ORY58727.1 NACHT domain-domain-containing protein [Pseudomassariella vexata]